MRSPYALSARHAGAVMVLGGTPVDLAKQAAAIATRHNRYSMTLDEDLLKEGITVGVALNGEKIQPVLNITAARAIKAEFNSAVMKVARVVQ